MCHAMSLLSKFHLQKDDQLFGKKNEILSTKKWYHKVTHTKKLLKVCIVKNVGIFFINYLVAITRTL